MRALLLAAGYATRLRPLTDATPKPLLAVGGRPMIDWILDRIDACEEIDAVHLVTNAVAAPAFARWAATRGVVVHDDGTDSNETRLGAIGDIRFARAQGGLGEGPLLVIAADNLFEFSLAEFIAFWRGRPGGSVLAVHRLADPSLARLYGVVELDADDRVIALEEKPEAPRSDLVSTATYLFAAAHVALIDRYLGEGNAADPPGAFLTWLCEREAVYGFRFSDEWLDIGELSQLLAADNRYRERAGLPARAEYSPE
jgi:glucose-1-phosphate thymidylyltransferase